MSPLEDRLREALRERATQSPVSPDAWPRTLARTGRRPWAPAWARFVIPVAAAAATIVIIVGAAVLTGHRSPDGTGATGPTAPATATPPASPGPDDYLMRATPPVTAVVPVKLTLGGKTTLTVVWFGYTKGARSQGIALCTETYGAGYGGAGGCESAPLPTGKAASSVGGVGSIKLGAAVRQAASVTALLPGGRRVPGVLTSGRGFPHQVWAVAYPQPNNAQVVFADTGGGRLGQLSFRAHSNSDSAISSSPADGRRPCRYSAAMSSTTPGGRTFTATPTRTCAASCCGWAGSSTGGQTIAAWPGSGLRLWSFPVPSSVLMSSAASRVMLGYDAGGRVVWQKNLLAAR